MEIRRLDKGDTEKAKKLYAEAFPEDPDKFRDWYFEKAFSENDAWGAFDGTCLLSMASVAHYKGCIRNKLCSANFLQSVATRKDAGGRGLASAIIRQILNALSEEGEGYSSLNTYIHGFYERLGYTPYTYRQRKTAEAAVGTGFHLCRYEDADDALVSQMSRLYKKAVEGRHGWRLRSHEDIQRLLYEYLYLGDAVLICTENESGMTGYAIAEEKGESLEAAEAIWIDTSAMDSFAAAAAHMGKQKFAYEENAEVGEPGRMMRIVNMSSAMGSLALGDGECVIWVRDEIIRQNNGAWHIFSRDGRTKATKTVADAGVEVSINDMTRLIMGVNVELNGDRNTVKMVQKVFSPMKCVNFELY